MPVLGPPLVCATGYWLVMQRETVMRPEVSAFRRWIDSELKAANDGGPTEAAPARLPAASAGASRSGVRRALRMEGKLG